MPPATEFTALGAGNGFPSCTDRVNVDTYDHWTTLSGVNKDNVAGFSASQLEAKIKESLVKAMKLYWNGFSLAFSAEAAGSTQAASLSNVDVSLSDFAEPRDRICAGARGTADDGASSVFVDMVLNFSNPARLYDNGVFVGYALSVADSRGYAAGRAYITLSLRQFVEEEMPVGNNEAIDFAYVDVGGMNFVCTAYARRTISTGTITADAAGISVEATAGGWSASSSITATDFGFYTY